MPKHYNIRGDLMNKITFQQAEYWVGSDTTKACLISWLVEIANGVYTPDQLKKDIVDHNPKKEETT
tara:strand:- start:1227 stop:1424 length:198 start_codon:yes stop_codon:yes gene_type:complete